MPVELGLNVSVNLTGDTTPATVNTTAGTITFTTAGFPSWYFGEANATGGDWTLLND